MTLNTDPRRAVHGDPALPARWEPWMLALLEDPRACADLMAEHGSPVNVHDFTALADNAEDLVRTARGLGVDLRVFVARKANKTLGLVDAVRRLGHGIDVGSERELLQVLERAVPPLDIVLTAAVKTERLLRHAMERGVPVALDNRDEAQLSQRISGQLPGPTPVVLRLAPEPTNGVAPTRFGESVTAWLEFIDANPVADARQRIDGVHFHLHGYSPNDRTTVLREAIAFVDELRARGHAPSFIDMGGGIPMSYIDDEQAWAGFWDRHEAAVMGQAEPVTWRGDGLGLRREDGPEGPRLAGTRDLYPYHQSLPRGKWLHEVLTGEVAPGRTAAQALAARGLVLHCEPGRSMLDGCGMTLARVAFRKHTSDGVPIIGLEMNRTQCRSTSADFLVDPALVKLEPSEEASSAPSTPSTRAWDAGNGAYLVGAYCIEAEVILRRRLRFPQGVAVGDVIALPNTAGYLMHILESASHQIPLAANVVWDGAGFRSDDIDG